ncbi:FG-GAP repeat domain-containing protein [Actinomadura sp. ATCC 39365]
MLLRMRMKKLLWPAVVLALTALVTAPTAQAAANGTGTSDFNGDGYQDLALGTSRAPGLQGVTGAVTVLYGGPNGISGHLVRRPAPGCLTPSKSPCSNWGLQVAAGDLDGDNDAELLFLGGYPAMQIDTWEPGGVRTVSTDAGGPNWFTRNLTIGQFDGQPGADIVGGQFELPYPGLFAANISTSLNGGAWARHYLNSGENAQDRIYSMATGDVHGTGRQQVALISSRSPNESPYLYLLDDLTPRSRPARTPRGPGAPCATPTTGTSSAAPGRTPGWPWATWTATATSTSS